MEESVVLDYYPTTLYPTEYEKTVKNGGYVKMPYLHSKGDSQPNLVYGGRKYKTESLYIVKSSSPDYDGEMVIKHAPITNGGSFVYLVVPLKTRPTVYEETAVDKIIHQTNARAFDFHAGEIIGYNQRVIVNEEGTVFVLSPMLVKSTFDDFLPFKEKEWSTTGKFRNIKLEFSRTKDVRGGEGGNIIEGLTTARRNNKSKSSTSPYDLYDCEPIFENDGKNKPTIEVMPVTSELAKNVGKMNAINATLHFALFVVIGIVAAIITPLSYKTLFVDYIVQLVGDATKRAASLKMFSYIGTAVLLFFSLGISINGVSIGDSMQTSIGVLMSIFLIISVGVITYFKQIDPKTYSLGFVDANFFKDSGLAEAFTERLLHARNRGAALALWATIVGISLIMYFFGKFDKNKKKDASKKNLILSYGFIFGALFALYISTWIMP